VAALRHLVLVLTASMTKPGYPFQHAPLQLPAACIFACASVYIASISKGGLRCVLPPWWTTACGCVVLSAPRCYRHASHHQQLRFPQVMPVLFAVVRSADEALRLFLLKRLAGLLTVLRQHLRRWLPDLVGLLHEFWGAGPGVLPTLLELVAELASELSIPPRIVCRVYCIACVPPAARVLGRRPGRAVDAAGARRGEYIRTHTQHRV